MKILKFTSLLLCFAALNAISVITNGQNITTVAGCGIGDDSTATRAELSLPLKIVFDHSGNSYIADAGANRIRKIGAGGIITTFAGTGSYGNTGDGGAATSATFISISSVAVDVTGNVYIADQGSNSIRMVGASGIISTIAGIGSAGLSGDGGPATAAQLNAPSDVIVDSFGNIYIADQYNHRVREVNTSGIIATLPGTTGLTGAPIGIAFGNNKDILITGYLPYHIYKVDTLGVFTTIAGTGAYGYSGDGGPATAATLSTPWGIAMDTSGNIYFSDYDNSRIRMINATTGVITTAAGNGIAGYGGDGSAADTAEISAPRGLSFGANNNLYIADFENNRIRAVNSAGIISTFAGQNGLFGEGYPGVNAEMNTPQNLTTDAAGNVYVADIFNNRVRMINAATGAITTVAGNGISNFIDGFSGDGGPATAAQMFYPSAVAVDAAGNLYITDQDNQRIRKVNASGIISTIAGNGTFGFAGDGGPATNAELKYPTGVAVDGAGDVFISDNNNQRVRKIDASGNITTIAGTGVPGFSGDGSAAVTAELSYPGDVAVDAAGNVYISDQGNNRIRMVDTLGIMHTIAGDGAYDYSGDGGPAVSSELANPLGLMVDNAGNIFFTDAGNNSVRVITTDGIINTLAGNGAAGFSGDGGPALTAKLNDPYGVSVDPSGNMYIADQGNQRVRKVNIAYLATPGIAKPLASISVYPNPAHDEVTIVSSSVSAGDEAVLYDVVGKEVLRTPIANAKQTLDIENLPGGVYILQVVNDKMVKKNVKVVKE